MINSLLNWQKRVIKLDRLIIKDQDGQESLITDSSQIKNACNHHFQYVASSSHSHKKNLFEWSLWTKEYQPKDDINSDIYQSLIDSPTLTEWLHIIHQLPSNKATEPSQISNKMLKHLGSATHHHLWLLIKVVLHFNDFSTQ